MTAAAKPKKVDRQEIYNKIVQMIRQSPNGQTEISSSDLARQFNVEPPTMDHHLKKLVSEGLLRTSSQRGRYNRKIYLLPEATPRGDAVSIHIVSSEGSAARKWLEERRRQAIGGSVTDISTRFKTEEPDQPAVPKQESLVQEEAGKPDPSVESVLTEKPVQPKEEVEIEVKELTLDDRIRDFLARSQSVPSAEVVLNKNDREILAVVTESLQQQMIYLRDLTEQLSTIQDKTLIQGLIEERNQHLERIKALEEEVKGYVQTISQMQKQTVQQQSKIDPQRVRLMHQVLINTVDTFVELPNHAMALKRGEFRKQITEEISNLVKYVLSIDN